MDVPVHRTTQMVAVGPRFLFTARRRTETGTMEWEGKTEGVRVFKFQFFQFLPKE